MVRTKLLNNQKIGDGVVLLKEIINNKDNSAYLSFVLSVHKTNRYYMKAFVSTPVNREIYVYIDKRPFKFGVLTPQKNGWQICVLKTKDGNSVN